jgi:hypothetical protein
MAFRQTTFNPTQS